MDAIDTMTRVLRIVIVTQLDPFYLPVFFEAFFTRLVVDRGSVGLCGVVIQRPLGNKTRKGLAKRVIALFGVWGTARKTLELMRNRIGDALYRAVIRSLLRSVERRADVQT